MCRSNLSTTSLHLVSRVARSWSSHRRARGLPFLVVLSVPEGWWSGGCGVPALHLKRGERGRVPASRRAYGALRYCLKKWPTTLRASGEKKNGFVWQVACANGWTKLSRGSGGGFFTKLMMAD
jgi:hypothetical protein